MIILFFKPTLHLGKRVIAPYYFIAQIVLGLLWLSFLDLIDPEAPADDDLDPYHRTRDRDAE